MKPTFDSRASDSRSVPGCPSRGRPRPHGGRDHASRNLFLALGLVVQGAVGLEEADRHPELLGQDAQGLDLIEDQPLDLFRPDRLSRRPNPSRSGRPGWAPATTPDSRAAPGCADGLGIAGMGAAADAGRGDSREQGPVVGAAFAQVGVQVDGSGRGPARRFRVAHRACPRIRPRRWNGTGSGPPRMGKYPSSGSAMRSGVRPSRCHPPGDWRG